MKRVQITLQANLHLVQLWNEQRRSIASPLFLMEERVNLVCVCWGGGIILSVFSDHSEMQLEISN